MKKDIVQVDGMVCAHCELAIQDAVRKLSGIKKVKASKRKKIVSVEYNDQLTNLDEIENTINSTGYTVKKS